VAPLDPVAVPAQDRVRAYQEREVTQFVHRELAEQAGEDSAVGIGERGLADLALDRNAVRAYPGEDKGAASGRIRGRLSRP
jgi:hypothetical protein